MWREAEARLAEEPPIIFQRGKNLVRPGLPEAEFADQSKGIVPGLHVQNTASIYAALTERITWVKWDSRAKKFKRRDPPERVARIMANVPGQWRLPQTSGIISCATLRPDGSLLMAPGYDQETGIYSFWNGGDLGVPPKPSRSDADELLALRAIISFLALAFGAEPFSVAQVIEIIGHSGRESTLSFHSAREPLSEKDRSEFREALLNVAGSRGVVNGKRLSTWLNHNTGRIIGAQRIERADRDRHTRALKWIIAKV